MPPIDDEGLGESIEAVLEAVEALGEDLASRDPEDMSFRVKVPQEPPTVKVLAELINELGVALDEHHNNLNKEMQQKTEALSEAYNALQFQNEEVQRELSMARRIQARLIPNEERFPSRDELTCAGFYRSMANVGGDLYDVLRIGRNSYGLLIADVAGHGIPAALITALVKIAFSSHAHWGVDPAYVCAQVNKDLEPILGDLDYYVTAWFGILNLEDGELWYSNAAHHPALLVRYGESEPLALDGKGRFLGMFSDQEYESKKIDLTEKDLLFLYTDGITESRNFFDEEYGYERLESCLMGMGELSPEGLVQEVRKDMEAFCMGADQRDDQSMMAIQFHEYSLAFQAESGIEESPAKKPVGSRKIAREPMLALLRDAISSRKFEKAAGILDVLALAHPDNSHIKQIQTKLGAL